MIDDSELSDAISTIVSLCRETDIDISEILDKYANQLKRKPLSIVASFFCMKGSDYYSK